jgi:hypothetical protein
MWKFVELVNVKKVNLKKHDMNAELEWKIAVYEV